MQKYFEIPLVGNTDLSQTSYRAIAITDYALYIEYNEGYIGQDWEEVLESKLVEVFGHNPFEEKLEPQPYQPTNAEVAQPYQPSNAEIAQLISDLQVDLIVAGVI